MACMYYAQQCQQLQLEPKYYILIYDIINLPGLVMMSCLWPFKPICLVNIGSAILEM